MNLDRPLVVFDLETTGLFPKKDRIIELGAIKVMPDGTEEAKCWLLNPGIPIPPESSSVHGITDDVVKNCPTFAERADEIFAFFGVSQRRCIDVQRIYHKMEPRDLTAAVRFYLGRDHAGAHGAEADTRATLDVLKAQLAKYPELPKTSEAMSEYLSPKDPNAIGRNKELLWRDGELYVNFGKKKGSKMRDMLFREKNFLEWILRGDFDTEVKAVVRDLLQNGRLPKPPSGK